MPVTSATPDRIVVELERLGFKYTLQAQYDVRQLVNPEPTQKDEQPPYLRRVQIREVKNLAPKENVEQFAIQMAYSPFPPIVVTRDGYIVDGNTRVAANLLRNEGQFPAYVIKADYEGVGHEQKNELHALAITYNQQGGQRLTRQEQRNQIVPFIEMGWLNEQIGRALGVKPQAVTQVRKEIDAHAKLAKVGLETNGDIPDASLRAFGSKDVLALNDAPFKALAELAKDAGFNAREVTTLAKEAKESGSDEAALAKVAAVRSINGDRIRQRSLTGSVKPPKSRRLRQALGYPLGFEGSERELVETDPGSQAHHTEVLQRAIAVLARVLEFQGAASS